MPPFAENSRRVKPALRPRTDAFYLQRADRSLFCVAFDPPPGVPPAGALLHLPAFAEEMNKSRLAVAQAARALASAGWHTLVFDPAGTGDSSGDFGDADWAGWCDDAAAAHDALAQRTGLRPTLWAHRAGALLASELAVRRAGERMLLWQPVTSGEAALTPFLRLRTVGAVAGGGRTRDSAQDLWRTLSEGQPIDVAGYRLPPDLALPMRGASLVPEHFCGWRIDWLEVSATEPPACMPASASRIEGLRAAGAQVSAVAVPGIPFWTAQEIDSADALVAASLRAFAPVAAPGLQRAA